MGSRTSLEWSSPCHGEDRGFKSPRARFINMNQVIEILKKTGAIIPNDHFVGVSGLHFDTYVNKDALLPHTKEVSAICQLFAQKYKESSIDVVAAPALGGIILSQWTAYYLSELTDRTVLGVYTEKTPENEQIFNRGYDKYVEGKRVLVLEDSTTTGQSVMKVVRAVQDAGGEVIEICVMVNRDPTRVNTTTLGIPFSSLAQLPIVSYEQKDCPLCKNGVPINTIFGHGKRFLQQQRV